MMRRVSRVGTGSSRDRQVPLCERGKKKATLRMQPELYAMNATNASTRSHASEGRGEEVT
ncbi:hypothetical protein E2C01_045267 [Portunus trituberculatus]|uniref:Uncharacterized protein n=1 Tax=Portunus trituberculatus TaxID=210409 RepID=A0A5B7FXV8_PORTR|nr:hypothetical protein [Portunus trituberculatus]